MPASGNSTFCGFETVTSRSATVRMMWSAVLDIGLLARARRDSVQRGDATPERFHMLPYLRVLFARVLVHVAHARQLQVGLQIPQRAGDIVEVVRQQSTIAQLTDRRRVQRQQHLRD